MPGAAREDDAEEGDAQDPDDEDPAGHRIVEAGAVALPSLDAFACACGDGMQSMGVSDIGARAFMVACEPYGVGLGVLFAAADGVLQRLAVIDSE